MNGKDPANSGKAGNVMTKEFAKMLALSLASVLLLAAAAVTSGGM